MNTTLTKKSSLLTAWLVILVVSLYRIVLQEVFSVPVTGDLVTIVPAIIVTFGFLLTFLWKDIRPLRAFFGVFIVLILSQWLILSRLNRLPILDKGLSNPSFSVSMLTEQGLKLLVTLIMIAFLFLIKNNRMAFYLTAGIGNAEVEDLRWLGVRPGEKWWRFGLVAGLCISLGTLLFLVLGGRPSLNNLGQVLPLLPAVFLAAALNAFNEEMTYKASFLSVLEKEVGKKQALLLMAAYFGFAHFYGVPYGIIGVIMAGILGWLLGKSMLETRGIFWAWFIHFLQDILIFTFLAIGSITPGG